MEYGLEILTVLRLVQPLQNELKEDSKIIRYKKEIRMLSFRMC